MKGGVDKLKALASCLVNFHVPIVKEAASNSSRYKGQG
ncbi:hypothetical protein CCACVL1_00944 [Corchorus capsularis]|uniref:Uncharacterized protein n=1 Tax=Corchorus capsularis TaxID=210143 RepID=A0A1R3KTT1_COCAP|nr:hypothetical protein CCACVL1_00944 [Corchorus capsularis]